MGKSRKLDSYRKTIGKRYDLIPMVQGVVLTGVIAFLFYKSILGMAAGVLIIPFWLKLKDAEQQAAMKSKLAVEFKEYMMLIVAGLQTGYSLEKAVKQSEIELMRLFPHDCVMKKYVHHMNQRIAMNVQLEKAFEEFAVSLELEEAISLAEIISFAKRSGGDYGKHIRETAIKIEENLAIRQEIETITTEKRLELKVMCVMPIGILAYISLTSSSFIAPLYGNLIGVGLMTVCLVAYGSFIFIGKRIIDIKV